MAVDALTRYLKRRGVQARLATPVIAVWPSSDRGRLSVTLLAMDGCRVVRGERLAGTVRRAVGVRPADPEIVEALRRLLNAHEHAATERGAGRAAAPLTGAMPQVRPRSQQPSPALPIVLCGVLLAVAAGWLHWPPIPVLWAAVGATAWAVQPPLLTGKRDAAGSPTPSGAGEARALRRWQFWRSLRWRLLVPNRDWLPGWPPLGSFVAAVCAAALAWCFPVAWWAAAMADAAAAFVLVCAVAARRRAAGTAAIPCPGTRVSAVAALRRTPVLAVVTAGAAVLGAATAGVAAAVLVPSTGEWAPTDPTVAVVAAAATAVCVVVAWPLSSVALEDWRTLTEAAEAWQSRWAALRFDPATTADRNDHRGRRDGGTRSEHHPPSGPEDSSGLASQITPALGAGVRVAVLEVPDTDSAGAARPGTRHPLMFQVVTWPATDLPDVTNIDTAVAALLIRSAMFWTMAANGYGQPMLESIERLTSTDSQQVDSRDSAGEADPPAVDRAAALETGSDSGTDVVGQVFDRCRHWSVARPVTTSTPGRRSLIQQTRRAKPARGLAPVRPSIPSPAAWRSTWAAPEGWSLESIRPLAAEIARNARCEVLIDHRQGFLFFGALTDAATAWTDPDTEGLMDRLRTEDRWTHIWSQVLKQGANPPTIQHATQTTVELQGGGELHRVGFVTRMGIDPADYRGLEPKLATALGAAPFVSVTGWPAAGDAPGSRHPQAFAVSWSAGPTPTAPQHLSPTAGAAEWLLAGRVNAAFDAARLARPELATACCLTAPGSPGGIWEITLRLYGGVTLADVRARAGRIRQSLDAPWLRIAPDLAGCLLFAGSHPEGARLADPGADRLRLTALDWDQAWADSGVTGKAGLLPDLVDTAPLPRNPDVGVHDFRLPPGWTQRECGGRWRSCGPPPATTSCRSVPAPARTRCGCSSPGTTRYLIWHRSTFPPQPADPAFRSLSASTANPSPTTRPWTRTCCSPGSPAPGSPAWRRPWCTGRWSAPGRCTSSTR